MGQPSGGYNMGGGFGQNYGGYQPQTSQSQNFGGYAMQPQPFSMAPFGGVGQGFGPGSGSYPMQPGNMWGQPGSYPYQMALGRSAVNNGPLPTNPVNAVPGNNYSGAPMMGGGNMWYQPGGPGYGHADPAPVQQQPNYGAMTNALPYSVAK